MDFLCRVVFQRRGLSGSYNINKHDKNGNDNNKDDNDNNDNKSNSCVNIIAKKERKPDINSECNGEK